jgi:TatD DNase family protein
MNLFDSHCHPQFPQYDVDREEVVKRTLAAGCGMICVGTDLKMSKKAIEAAERYEGVWATVGCHPNESIGKLQLEDYEELAKHPKAVAIGEVGLDYYRTPEKDKQEKQKETFQRFLELAKKLGKPVIIHCRNAYDDMPDILKNNSVAGVIHSFTGNFELAEKFIDSDFYLGLNGIITFTGEYDDMIAKLPLDRILLETDAPYLAPEPYRGKRNEPLYVAEVAKKIARLKGVDYDEIANAAFENTKELFKIHIPKKFETRLVK